jgi:transposase-like protein
MDVPKRGEAKEYWNEAVRLWAASGLSVREFCGREGLAEHSFYFWRRRLRLENPVADAGEEPVVTVEGPRIAEARPQRQKSERVTDLACNEASAVKFLPVRVLDNEFTTARPKATEAAEPSPIEILLGGDRLLRVRSGFDRKTLLDVLAALEARSC